MSNFSPLVAFAMICFSVISGQPEANGYFFNDVDMEQFDLPAKAPLVSPTVLAALTAGPKVRRVGSMGWGPGGTPVTDAALRYYNCLEKARRTGGEQSACSEFLMIEDI